MKWIVAVVSVAESRPAFVEEEAVHRALYLARHVGVRIQIVHTSSPESVDLVADARARGLRATAEVCPHHLLLDLDDLVRLGPYGRCAPALRPRELVEGMWERVLDGTLDPSPVFDMEVDMEHVPDGYAAMDERRAIKVVVRA